MVTIDISRALDLIGTLGFTRVLGTTGERRAQELIVAAIDCPTIVWQRESFAGPWVDIVNARFELGGATLPVTPLISPVYDSVWMPVPRTLDVCGVLRDQPPADVSDVPWIAVRGTCDNEHAVWSGAAAQIFVCEPVEEFVAYYLASTDGLPPSVYLPPGQLSAVLDAVGTEARLRWESTDTTRVCSNLIAEITGSAYPDDVIAVGAHLDTFPGTSGADDDAAGCALLAELATWYARHRPQRTVRFLWLTGEELDRRGSRNYAQRHRHDQARLRLYVNLDSGMSRNHDGYRLLVSGPARFAAELPQFLSTETACARVGAEQVDCADTHAFRQIQVPTVFPVAERRTNPRPWPHLPTDTVDVIDPDRLHAMGRLAFAVVDTAQNGELSLPCDAGRPIPDPSADS